MAWNGRVVQRKHSVDVLLAGAIFCGCDVHATFSEPVGVRDAVDEACGKQLERSSAEQDPGTSSRQERTRHLEQLQPVAAKNSFCFFVDFSCTLFLGQPKACSSHRAERSRSSEHVMFYTHREEHGGTRGRGLNGTGVHPTSEEDGTASAIGWQSAR